MSTAATFSNLFAQYLRFLVVSLQNQWQIFCFHTSKGEEVTSKTKDQCIWHIQGLYLYFASSLSKVWLFSSMPGRASSKTSNMSCIGKKKYLASTLGLAFFFCSPCMSMCVRGCCCWNSKEASASSTAWKALPAQQDEVQLVEDHAAVLISVPISRRFVVFILNYINLYQCFQGQD